ncbi:MAG: hypothetical protein IJK15_01450 [Bacteroidaceae bacterium]|nr:hypothetical protein [Bacteroidaceae bacterium]
MKKIFKYSLMLLTAGLVLTSCGDTYEYSPAAAPAGAQVYFSNEGASTVELSKSASSFNVTVLRANTQGDIDVPVTATMPDGSIYNVPATVHFADGESSANLVITYNPDQLNYGDYTDISLQIGDENYTTPYGVSTYAFKAGATAWVSMGNGLMRDDLFTSWYNIDNMTYEVEIEKNVVEEGLYRVVNPYGATYPYNDPGDWDASQNYYMVIDATDPDYVWIPEFHTGTDWGKGEMWFLSFVQYYLDRGSSLAALKSQNPEYFGTFEDGIFSFPTAESMLAGRGEEGYWYSNPNGLLAVALPGARFSDYTIEYEYVGRFIDTDKQYYVEGVPTLGEDVITAKAALVTADTYEAVREQMIAGEAGIDIANGEAFRLPFDETGTYYVLILAFNEEGEVANELTSKVNAVIESGEPSITWEPAYVGDYYYSLLSDPDAGEMAIDEGLVLSVDADNSLHFQIAPWGNKQTLELYVNEDGSVTVPADQPSGISGAKGELFVADVQTYTGGDEKYAKYVSTFADSKFTLYLIYYNDGESYLGADTFTLTGTAEVKKAVRISHKRIANLKSVSNKLPKKDLKFFVAK